MKIERISDNKIKIVLAEKEITRWSNIPQGRIPDYNSMMLDLITAAEKETGISFHNCQVIVEATKSNENCYVVYVTKNAIGRPSSRPASQRPVTHRTKAFLPGTETAGRVVAEFTDIETICEFDRHYPFYAKLLAGKNSLYAYNGQYYLDITVPPFLS